MKKLLYLSLISLLVLSGEIFAEGRCPAGMFETGSRDYLACAPIPGYGLGAVNSFKSELAATQAAVQQCRTTATISQTKCEVQISYRNQCAAYAWGAGRSVASHAIDIPTATEDALKSCGATAGTTCKIYYSGCSYAEAVPK